LDTKVLYDSLGEGDKDQKEGSFHSLDYEFSNFPEKSSSFSISIIIKWEQGNQNKLRAQKPKRLLLKNLRQRQRK